jgi:hypothetical protein
MLPVEHTLTTICATLKPNCDMPDLLVRAIDDALAERIKRYAQERAQPLNQCMLEIIDLGLVAAQQKQKTDALNTDLPSLTTAPEVRTLGGTWSGDEARAFADALKAIQGIR